MDQPANPASLARIAIFQRLRAEILSCELRPGLRLQERELAERFEVSKSPIRDALLRLEEQNLVEVVPRKGYRVRPISIADARDVYDLRSILERECLPRLIDVASDRMLADLDRFREVLDPIELDTWVEYNRRFHLALADGCGNARLARATRDVTEQFDRFTIMSVTRGGGSGNLLDYVSEHREIIDAIQARDKRRAVSLMRDHIDRSRRRTLEALAAFAVTQ